jgi:hypothetical protein
MMVYKMVAYQQPMQDSNFSLTSHHPLGHSTATRELYRTAAAIGRCQLARPPNPLPPLVTYFQPEPGERREQNSAINFVFGVAVTNGGEEEASAEREEGVEAAS